MKETQVKRERDKVKELAREYRKKGYNVIIEPTRSDLPRFMSSMNFQPDLIALSDKENLVFEVKTGSTIHGIKEFATIADTIREHEGWDFVFVMTNPKEAPTPKLSSPHPRIEDAYRYINKAALLLDSDKNDQFNEAALLIAWSGVEATIRYALATVYEKTVEKNVTSLLRDSVMYGVISKTDAKYLDSVLSIRNEIAHGFTHKQISKNKVGKLIEIIRRIINALESEKHLKKLPADAKSHAAEAGR